MWRALFALSALVCLLGVSGCDTVAVGPAFSDLQRVDLRDARTAADFARAWQATHAAEDPEYARFQLGGAWVGRQYRWTGYALAGLCQADTCSVRIASSADARRFRLGGAMALVRFRPEAARALRTQCGGATGCEVDFEGMLVEARTHPDLPLRLVFEGAAVRATRPPAQAWFARVARTPIKSRGDLRTGERAKPAFRVPIRRF